jgi:hypothetical protein
MARNKLDRTRQRGRNSVRSHLYATRQPQPPTLIMRWRRDRQKMETTIRAPSRTEQVVLTNKTLAAEVVEAAAGYWVKKEKELSTLTVGRNVNEATKESTGWLP